MNRRELFVMFLFWLFFVAFAYFFKGTFVGGISMSMTFMLPMFLLLAHFEPKIQKWLRDGDKK